MGLLDTVKELVETVVETVVNVVETVLPAPDDDSGRHVLPSDPGPGRTVPKPQHKMEN